MSAVADTVLTALLTWRNYGLNNATVFAGTRSDAHTLFRRTGANGWSKATVFAVTRSALHTRFRR